MTEEAVGDRAFISGFSFFVILSLSSSFLSSFSSSSFFLLSFFLLLSSFSSFKDLMMWRAWIIFTLTSKGKPSPLSDMHWIPPMLDVLLGTHKEHKS